MKSFTYSGVWWLPSQEGHKVAGEATFTGSGLTKLALHGLFPHKFKPGEFLSNPWYPIILGTTTTGQPITLYQCQETYSSSFFAEEGEEGGEQVYSVTAAFAGTHFTESEFILFNEVDIYYSYLPQWAGLFPFRGYQKPFNEVRASTTKGTVTVQLVEHVWNELTKEADLIKETDLPEVVRIKCAVQEALPLEEWTTQLVFPLQHLISLATQRPNAIVNLVGYVKQNEADQSKGGALEVPVQITFPPAIIPIPTDENTVPGHILFSLEEVADNFSQIIEKWLHNADELASVYSLFFGVRYTNLLLDLRFLLLAQAVEVYQDHRFEKTALPEEEYQELMEIILSACPDEKKEWLVDALQYSNHATFRQQLRNFISQTNAVLHPLLGKSRKERDELIEVIYNTRNYLTHHTKELVSKSASGGELLYATRCLSLALQVCLMKELGFTVSQLTKAIQKHEDNRHIPFLQTQVDLKKLTS